MTIADLKLALLSLPDDLRIVTHRGPQLHEVFNARVIEAITFVDGSIRRSGVHCVSEPQKIKVLELDFVD